MRVWALNLDAEIELAHPGGGAYTPSRRVLSQLSPHAARFAATLPAGDRALEAATDPEGAPGEAWCPTPRALAALRRAGVTAPDAPPLEVLRRVNGRAFAFGLASLPEARLCRDEGEVARALERPGSWLAKRELSFAGRGRRRLEGPGREPDRGWIGASLAQGPLLVTPWVEIELEVARHGYLERGGELRAGRVTVQRVDPGGQHVESSLAGPDLLRGEEERALEEAFADAAEALGEAGYFGPFGIDAFRYRTPAGRPRFHPLSDLNARYSMGWFVGMGG